MSAAPNIPKIVYFAYSNYKVVDKKKCQAVCRTCKVRWVALNLKQFLFEVCLQGGQRLETNCCSSFWLLSFFIMTLRP